MTGISILLKVVSIKANFLFFCIKVGVKYAFYRSLEAENLHFIGVWE